MLTTTLDGLWVLQALCGVEQTCPELGLRPLIPRLDTPELARAHPIAAELTELGALDANGHVDPMIREWLTVIMRRDVSVVVVINVPGSEPTRVSISRFATWWVVLERHDTMVKLYPAGTASDGESARELLIGQIEKVCGVAPAAELRAATLDTNGLLASVRDEASLHRFLIGQGLDGNQVQILSKAADRNRCARADIVAIQAGAGPEETARMAIGDSTVSLIDTEHGRICAENVVGSGGHRYQVLGPGTRTDIAAAVSRLIERLPAGQEWHSHRRVV